MAVAFPADARLIQRASERLVRLTKKHGLVLRQSYERVGKRALIAHQRYAHEAVQAGQPGAADLAHLPWSSDDCAQDQGRRGESTLRHLICILQGRLLIPIESPPSNGWVAMPARADSSTRPLPRPRILWLFSMVLGHSWEAFAEERASLQGLPNAPLAGSPR
jgi:hypothetical protein